MPIITIVERADVSRMGHSHERKETVPNWKRARHNFPDACLALGRVGPVRAELIREPFLFCFIMLC